MNEASDLLMFYLRQWKEKVLDYWRFTFQGNTPLANRAFKDLQTAQAQLTDMGFVLNVGEIKDTPIRVYKLALGGREVNFTMNLEMYAKWAKKQLTTTR